MIRLLISFVGLRTLAVVLAACCFAPPVRAQAPAPLPRIAIVPASEDRDLGTLADLLIVSMARASQRYELVERAELNRIAQEAEVQAMSAAERPRALARLAKADGLILLTVDLSEPGHRSISARLSITDTALIRQTVMLGVDEKDLPTAAKLVADTMRFAAERLGKAGSSPKQIISLLGIRATVPGSSAAAIETTVNTALTHHLSSIPGLATVERWKLDDIAFERSLSDKALPLLATGTVLVDGSLEVKAKAASVKARIRKSQDDPGKVLSIEGPADDASLLARNIAIKLAAECGDNAIPVPWDIQAEANAYASLGNWLLKHSMGREAAEAYESAVALGDNSRETLYNRIYAYIVLTHPNNSLGSSPSFEAGRAFRHNYSQIDREKFPLVLASVNRAMAYAELLLQKPSEDAASFWAQEALADGIGILACRTLMAAHRLKLHIEHSAEIRTLRQRAESFLKLFERERRRFGGETEHQVDVLAGYWAASPEQAAEYWHNLLTNAKPARLRRLSQDSPLRRLSQDRYDLGRYLDMEGFGFPQNIFIGMPVKSPYPLFVDWSTLDNAHGERCWRNLLNQLRASKSLVNQFDGIALAIYTAPPSEERDKLLLSSLDFLEQNRRSLNEPEGQAVFCAFFAQPGPRGYPPKFAERYASLVESLFGNSSRMAVENFGPIRQMLERLLTRYPPGAHVLPKPSAERVLLAIGAYAERTPAPGESPVARYGLGGAPEGLIAAITRAYPDLKAPPPAQAPMLALDGDSIPIQFLSMAREAAPTDTNFWIMPGSVKVCGDGLFASRSRSRELESTFVRKDLTKSEIPPMPRELYHSRTDAPYHPGRPLLPTRNGFLSFTWEGVLLGYDFQAGRWSDESGLLPEHLRNSPQGNLSAGRDVASHHIPPVVRFVNDTLYLATADNGHTIGRRMNGKYELIASSRRRPAEHALDEVTPSKVIAMFSGPGKRPYAMLSQPDRCEVHDLELQKRVATFMTTSQISFDGNVAVITNDYMVATIDPDSEQPRCLIRRPPEPHWFNDVVLDDLPRQTAWEWPPNFEKSGELRVAVHGDCLFYLKCARSPGSHAGMGAKMPPQDKVSLVCFQPGRKEPLEIPLSFQPETMRKFLTQKPGATPLPFPPEFSSRELVTTSAGLFFNFNVYPIGGAIGDSPGLLHVPWKDVNDWLTRHGHTPIGIRATTETALTPK